MQKAGHGLIFMSLLIGLLSSVMGCAHQLTPVLEARVTPAWVKEKFPWQVALVITEQERQKTHTTEYAFNPFHTFQTELRLGTTLETVLVLSLSQVFDRVTVVGTQPDPGAYQAVLIPAIAGAKWTKTIPSEFVLSGTLRVLDQSGRELARFEEEGKEKIRAYHVSVVDEESGAVVSQAIGNLVARWIERLGFSAEVQQYASRLGPPVAAQAGGTIARPPSPDVTISFSYPAEAARVSAESITVVGIVSAPKGISRLDLVVNGRSVPVSRDVRVQSEDVHAEPFAVEVQLRAGVNVIALTAVDTRGQAAQALRTVFLESTQPMGPGAAARPVPAGERWAVVIGIDRYKDPSIAPLRYAVADAEAVYRFLTTTGGVKAGNTRLLLNQDATQRNIRQVLGDLLRQQALKDDEVIIYYAGHGTTEPDAGAEGGIAKYLVPWDADSTSLFSTAIPMEEIDRIFGRLATRKILMIQDTCFSGGSGGRTFLAKGLTRRAGTLTDRFLQELTQKEGRLILTASDVNQVSHEDATLRHGIFTHYFLEGLTGAADLDGDGAVTVREMHLFLQRRVHQHSGGTQTPQLYAIGDMVLIRK